jgi:sterol desaturase/sphingolipid hydroxylase (fatty acid hydroxylase superfamily)
METQTWFCFLDEHHYIHHVDTEANVNFLLPLADWLFGTLRRTLTSEELTRHGSREAAKSFVRGVGEPAYETSMYGQRIVFVAAETAFRG